MNKYGFIIEGVNDAKMIESLHLNTHSVVTGGTRFNNRCRMNIDEALSICKEVFILTDPDESGDILAKMISDKYPQLRRILLNPVYCTQDKLSFKGKPYKKTGVENASPAYLEMVIHYYINHPEFTGHLPFKESVETNS